MAQYGCAASGITRHRTWNFGFIPADVYMALPQTKVHVRDSWYPLAQCSYSCQSWPLANVMLCGHSVEVLNNFLIMSLNLHFAIGPSSIERGGISSYLQRYNIIHRSKEIMRSSRERRDENGAGIQLHYPPHKKKRLRRFHPLPGAIASSSQR